MAARERRPGQALPQLPVGPVPLLEAALAARLGAWLEARLGARLGARPGARLGARPGARLGARLEARLGGRLGARIVQGREEDGWLQQGRAAVTQAQLATGSVQSRNGKALGWRVEGALKARNPCEKLFFWIHDNRIKKGVRCASAFTENRI